MRMRYIVICGLSDCTVFSTLSHKRHDVRKKFLNLKCVFWMSVIFFLIFLFLRRNERDVIKNVCRSSRDVHVIFVKLQWILNFPDKVSKSTEITNFMKIRPVEPSCSIRMNGRTDGQTDKTKLIVAFRNSRTRLKINRYCPVPYVNRLGCKSTPILNFVLSDSRVHSAAGPGITKHQRSVILSL